jgi:ornithine cyclodeaminase
MAAAIEAIERALLNGLDPAADPARSVVDVPAGQFLLMPASHGAVAGVKLVTIAPSNPARGLPRIQGVFVLWDAETLAPVALMDGAALTSVRTPAVSAVAARRLASASARLVVFGTGPQAAGHVLALREVLRVGEVFVVGRDAERASRFAESCGAAVVGDAGEAVEAADVICCCTTAREPLFDGSLVRDGALVIAIGSHEPEARELDSTLMGRAVVVVESRETALREAGDVIQAADEGALDPDALITIDSLVRGEADDTLAASAGPRVFKSAGMSWEDVAVAGAAWTEAQK